MNEHSSSNEELTEVRGRTMASFPMTSCAACRLPIIHDQYVMQAVGGLLQWHPQCVRCAECGNRMEQSSASYFAMQGMLFCRQDFDEFSKRIVHSRLHRGVDLQDSFPTNANEFTAFSDWSASTDSDATSDYDKQSKQEGACQSMISFDPQTSHVTDSRDSSSNLQWIVGQSETNCTSMRSNCSLTTSLSSTPTLTASSYSCPSASPAADVDITVVSQQPMESRLENDTCISQGIQQSNRIESASTMPWFTNDDISTSFRGKQHASEDTGVKTPRLRTVLNEYQLHVLRTCYAATSRPDQATKDKLEEMTGLNSRVIRVWFQNKRCKDKKRPSTFFLKRS